MCSIAELNDFYFHVFDAERSAFPRAWKVQIEPMALNFATRIRHYIFARILTGMPNQYTSSDGQDVRIGSYNVAVRIFAGCGYSRLGVSSCEVCSIQPGMSRKQRRTQQKKENQKRFQTTLKTKCWQCRPHTL